MYKRQTYSFLAKNVKIEEAGNVQFTYDNTVAKVELANADYNGRGALFTVTALKTGSTDIKATYNNEEATMKLDVVEYTGKMTLDTASYTMPLGGTYTIGVKIEKNGKQLTGAEVNAMIASGELVDVYKRQAFAIISLASSSLSGSHSEVPME